MGWLERIGGDAEAFDGAEHRDRRGDDAIAVEQTGAEQRRQGGHTEAGARLDRRARRQERGQRQDAALAFVVGAQHEGEVLDHHHEQQRPQDEREHAEHRRRFRGHRVLDRRVGETLLERVQR
jgi:hypothetical protein